MTFLKAIASPAKKTLTSFLRQAGNSSKLSTEVDMCTSIYVGAQIPVGEFFWIPDRSIIGFDSDARHGHEVGGGSVDVGCCLTVRAIKNDFAIVRLDRPELPYGAPAAIGTVFQIPISMMQTWPDKIRAQEEHEKQRAALAAEHLH